MSNNVSIVGVNSPEELHTYMERQRANGFSDLPPNRRAFAHEYILDYKHRAAAKTTGFSVDTGIKLLRDPLVAEYITHLQSLQLTTNLITKDFINAQYMHLYEMATGQVEQHCVLPDGEEYTAKKTELGTAHNILDKMSKSTEYAKETGEKNAPVSISIDFGGLRGDSVVRGIGGDETVGITIDHE